jgi:hypothetical protein
MANVFKNYLASATGTSPASVYTVAGATTAVTIGMNIANIATAQIKVSAYISSGGTDYYIAKDVPIPAGSALSVLDGKIILEAADVVKVVSDTATSADTVLSVLEQS